MCDFDTSCLILPSSTSPNDLRKGEDPNAQYNLEIALNTIQELQLQLVHSNRCIEQLAAEVSSIHLFPLHATLRREG